jgi:hypothetical protein
VRFVAGNTYFIENIADRDAKLFFTQARKVAAGEDVIGSTTTDTWGTLQGTIIKRWSRVCSFAFFRSRERPGCYRKQAGCFHKDMTIPPLIFLCTRLYFELFHCSSGFRHNGAVDL